MSETEKDLQTTPDSFHAERRRELPAFWRRSIAEEGLSEEKIHKLREHSEHFEWPSGVERGDG